MYFKCYMIVEYYLTAYPAVYGQFPQAIPQPIAAVPAQREGKISPPYKTNTQINTDIICSSAQETDRPYLHAIHAHTNHIFSFTL